MNSAADWYAEQEYLERCGMPHEGESMPKQKMTNADRIRQMTDEELAEFLSKVKSYCIKIPCGKCDFYDAESSVDDIICSPLYWLKQEVDQE